MLKHHLPAKICLIAAAIVCLNGCRSTLNLHLWSNKERTKYLVDGMEVGENQRVSVALENGLDISHTIIARRGGFCEMKDEINPPYSNPTVVDFLFKEDDECIPCPPPCYLDYGKYYALVIGNDDYAHSEIPELQTARNDAREIAGLLKSRYGYTVKLLENASFQDIVTALKDFRNGSSDGNQSKLTERDSLLIYYAGHGQILKPDDDNPQGYWLPVDAKPDSQSTWISNSFIADQINSKSLKANHVMIIADSCYSGLLTRNVIGGDYPGLERFKKGTKSYNNLLWRLFSKPSRTALTAGGKEPVIDGGGSGNHSVFASALIDILSNNLWC